MPNILVSVIEQAFRLGGWSPDDLVIWLPLRAKEQVVGGLAVWGPDLQEEDLPTLLVFASQVGITIENVRLYAAERQRAEEKDVLLQEIHHRVKNNLQVIASLLRLQAGRVADEQTRTVFEESCARIRSMAFAHEMLYRSADLSEVDLAQYIPDLASYLRRLYQHKAGSVQIKNDIGELGLSIDTAIPCGLIINELVSNAFKHGFPDGHSGTIDVRLCADDGAVALTVQDDGVGLPAELDWRQTETLGLRLVVMLVEQIEGSIELDQSEGTTWKITFGRAGRS
jgi:two-component sensor histidine kinase